MASVPTAKEKESDANREARKDSSWAKPLVLAIR